MRVIFAGTPGFAVASLDALIGAGHAIMLVLTQPDRSSGRGLAATPSPVKRAALAHGIPVYQPERLKDHAALATLAEAAPDVIVVAAYGLILPPTVLELPSLGAVNVHASMLPRWRGAAPIQRALLAGDSDTGVCIMRMDAGLDTGPVLRCERCPIAPDETAGTLHDKLAALGASLLPTTLAALAAGTLVATPQPAEGATYAAKLEKHEGRVDWKQPAAAIERQIRAFNPSPGATTRLRGMDIKIWRASIAKGDGAPGTVIDTGATGVRVGCGTDALLLTELQRAGGKRLDAAEFLRGVPLAPGERFESN